MDKKVIWISILTAAIGFAGGFLVANTINRTELAEVRGENERLKTEASAKPAGSNEMLSNEEIEEKIAEADRNPGNFEFQKNLGLALYRYAAMKQDVDLLGRAIKLLERAESLNGDAVDIKIALGNAHFDVGYFSKNNSSFERARGYYEAVLDKDPTDVEVRTDIGLTYFLQEPPDAGRAIENFRQSLEASPNHEKTLQFIIQAYLKQGNRSEAARYLEQLKKVNPDSKAVSELAAMVAQSGAAQQ